MRSFLGWNKSPSNVSQANEIHDFIEQLSDRLKTATLIEEKRSSLLELKNFSSQYQLEVGTLGMPSLIECITQHQYDTDLVVVALETLINLCSNKVVIKSPKGENNFASPPNKFLNDFGTQFSEIFLKDKSNILTLLNLLDDSDYHVRYYTIKFFQLLLNNKSILLKEMILESPFGIQKFIELLNDSKEALQYEGLIFLIDLAKDNNEIQKIIAFQNTFERLIDLIGEQGGLLDNGHLLLTIFELITNLLEFNYSNQSYFRETNCLQRICNIFIEKISASIEKFKIFEDILPNINSSSGGSHHHIDQVEKQLRSIYEDWNTREKIDSVLSILSLFRLLLQPRNPNTKPNQKVLFQGHLLDALLFLITFPQTISLFQPMIIESLLLLGDFIRDKNEYQKLFAKCNYQNYHYYTVQYMLQSDISFSNDEHNENLKRMPIVNDLVKESSIPSLLGICWLTLDKNLIYSIRRAALYTLQSYMVCNIDGQLEAVSGLIVPPSQLDNQIKLNPQQQPIGPLILSVFTDKENIRKDPLKHYFSSILLSSMIYKNDDAKSMILKYQVMENNQLDEDEGVLLLHHVMQTLISLNKESLLSSSSSSLITNENVAQIGIYSFLIVWLHQYPPAITMISQESLYLHFLLEQIKKSSLVVEVQGLAAFLYGLLIFYPPSDRIRSELMNIVRAGIGIDLVFSKLCRLKESPSFVASVPDIKSTVLKDLEESNKIILDPILSGLMKEIFDHLMRLFNEVDISEIKEPNASAFPSELETLIDTLKNENSTLKVELQSQNLIVTQLKSQNESLLDKLKECEHQIKSLKSENEDLLACIGEMENNGSRSIMKPYEPVIPQLSTTSPGQYFSAHLTPKIEPVKPPPTLDQINLYPVRDETKQKYSLKNVSSTRAQEDFEEVNLMPSVPPPHALETPQIPPKTFYIPTVPDVNVLTEPKTNPTTEILPAVGGIHGEHPVMVNPTNPPIPSFMANYPFGSSRPPLPNVPFSASESKDRTEKLFI